MGSRKVLLAILAVMVAAPLAAGAEPPKTRRPSHLYKYKAAKAAHPSGHPYRKQYVRETFGKGTLAGVGARAGINQARRSPKEWGDGVGGFGKRLASGMGTHVVDNTIKFGVAAARHEDLRYYPSTRRGFGPRMRHALVSTVVTRKTTTGKKTVAAGRISGAMGSGVISRAWLPASAGGVGAGVATGGITLGAAAGANVAREFWPRKKRVTRVRRSRSHS